MLLLKRLLILEDDLKTLSILLKHLAVLEQDQPFSLSVMVLTDNLQVKTYINDNPKAEFDIILLDYDDKLNETFHVLNIERFGADKVISISSTEINNEEAKKRGVNKIVMKDYQQLDELANKVIKMIELIIRDQSRTKKPHSIR
jgi:hypothetical protein